MDAHSNSRSIAPDSAVRAAVDNNGGSTGQDHVIESKIDFHHPYTPYAIQEEFMSTVYRVLEEGKVGILESPTGTVSNIYLLSTRYHVTQSLLEWRFSCVAFRSRSTGDMPDFAFQDLMANTFTG